jgi:hypothetical protein
MSLPACLPPEVRGSAVRAGKTARPYVFFATAAANG